MYLIEGFLLGLASIIFIGPVVFVLINASISKGIPSGISVALGIIVGDIIYTVICYRGLNYLKGYDAINDYIAYIGIILLLSSGIFNLFKKDKYTKSVKGKNHVNLIGSFLKGFAINFFNPFVLSVWLLVVNYAKENHTEVSIYYLFAVLAGILFIDILKVFLSSYLIKIFGSNKLFWLYKISGIIMIIFALRILYSLF